jgi:hypothetical protein
MIETTTLEMLLVFACGGVLMATGLFCGFGAGRQYERIENAAKRGREFGEIMLNITGAPVEWAKDQAEERPLH